MSFIVVPEQFPVTMLATAVICLECFLIGIVVVGPARGKAFTAEHMAKFKDEHEKAFPGSEPAARGYPDAGEGRYSDKLPYKQWVEFNNAMRTHTNFVEMLPVIVFTLVLGGLFLPRVTMWVAIANAIARIIYTVMYATKGSNSRIIGAVAGSLPLYVVLIWTIVKLFILAF